MGLAPVKAMQFGHPFQHLMQNIAYADPKFGTVQMMKIDLADGYYQVPLSPSGIPHLSVITPFSTADGDPLIAFPITLPMGWKDSPPFFCAFTETIGDVSNRQLRTGMQSMSPHPLKAMANDHGAGMALSCWHAWMYVWMISLGWPKQSSSSV